MRRGQLIPWGPFRDLDRFLDEDFWQGAFVPAVDIYQDKDNVIVEVDAPGMDKDKLNIAVENDVLTIEGSKELKSEVKKEDYYRKEIRCGIFSRSVILPMSVKGEEAKAEYQHGVLKVTLPKAEEAKPKKIDVQVKE